MDERRKLQRKFLAFFTRVFDESNGELLGHLADITAEGMMLISTHPVETGEEYKLLMDLPDYVFGIDHLVFRAKSIWCQPDIDPTFFTTGFQFLVVTPQIVDITEKIVQEYRIRE